MLTLAFAGLSSSCSMYRHHVPRWAEDNKNAVPIVMTIGEKRRVMSRTAGAAFSPGFMPPPSTYIVSSDPGIVALAGEWEATAYAVARKGGIAKLIYSGLGDATTMVTPVRVIEKGEQVEAGRPLTAR